MISARMKSVLSISLCLAASMVLAGCAEQGSQYRTSRDQLPTSLLEGLSSPSPQALKEKIAISEEIGGELYINDKMAAIAADVLRSNVKDLEKAGICGYIVFREGNAKGRPSGSWLVEFFVDKAEPKIGFIVRITPPPDSGKAKTQFHALVPPEKPGDFESLLFRSTRTAIDSLPEQPKQPLNPVVVPGAAMGKEGILVYLLAGARKDNVAVFGKHYRVLVSKDGQKAISIEPLSGTELESEIVPPKPGDKPVSLFVTHKLGDYPLETHVFVSMRHHLPVVVSTSKYDWQITEGKIRLMSSQTGGK